MNKYSTAGVVVGVGSLLAVAVATVTNTFSSSPVARPSGALRFSAGSLSSLPDVAVSLKGCGGVYKVTLAVGQKLHIVNVGTVMRHQINTGSGAIVMNLAPRGVKLTTLTYPSVNWSAAGKGTWTLKFVHKSCATPESVIATVG